MKYFAITSADQKQALGTGTSIYAAWDNTTALGNTSGSSRDESLVEIEITKDSYDAIRNGNSTAISPTAP